MKVKFKKLNETATEPAYASEHAAGADLYSAVTVTVPAHHTEKVGTGIAIEPVDECVALIYARSGLATKSGLAPANKVGVVDCDYRGEVIVALHNHSDKDYVVMQGDRIAQLVFAPYIRAEFEEADELSETSRMNGGFGSTGK